MTTGHFPEGLGCHASGSGCLKSVACALPWSPMGGKEHRGVGLADGRGTAKVCTLFSQWQENRDHQPTERTGTMLERLEESSSVKWPSQSVGRCAYWEIAWGGMVLSALRDQKPPFQLYPFFQRHSAAANSLSGLIRAGHCQVCVCVKGEGDPRAKC